MVEAATSSATHAPPVPTQSLVMAISTGFLSLRHHFACNLGLRIMSGPNTLHFRTLYHVYIELRSADRNQSLYHGRWCT